MSPGEDDHVRLLAIRAGQDGSREERCGDVDLDEPWLVGSEDRVGVLLMEPYGVYSVGGTLDGWLTVEEFISV